MLFPQPDLLNAEGRLDLLDAGIGIVHRQNGKELFAGGMTVLVFANKIGIALGRGKLLFYLNLAFVVLESLVLNFDEGKTPIGPVIAAGVEGNQGGFLFELLEPIDGKVPQGGTGSVELS